MGRSRFTKRSFAKRKSYPHLVALTQTKLPVRRINLHTPAALHRKVPGAGKRQQDTRAGGETVGGAGLPSTTWCLRKASKKVQCGPILSNCRQQKIRLSLGVRRPHRGLKIHRHVTLIAHLIPYGTRAAHETLVRLQQSLQTIGAKPTNPPHLTSTLHDGAIATHNRVQQWGLVHRYMLTQCVRNVKLEIR
jgi:hypothetical protein